MDAACSLTAHVGALVSSRMSVCYTEALTRQGPLLVQGHHGNRPVRPYLSCEQVHGRTDGQMNDHDIISVRYRLPPHPGRTVTRACFMLSPCTCGWPALSPVRPWSPKSGTRCPRARGRGRRGGGVAGRQPPGGQSRGLGQGPRLTVAVAEEQGGAGGLQPRTRVAPSASGF